MFNPSLFTSLAKEVAEPVPSFPCSEYFNLHYSGTPGNFELTLLKGTNLLCTVIPEYEGEHEGHVHVVLSMRSGASWISLSVPGIPGFPVIDCSLGVSASEQPDDLWLL